MSDNKKPSRYADVIRVFRMVHGFSGMLTLSVVIRAANKLASISLAVVIALLVEQAVTGIAGSLIWWGAAMGAILFAAVALSYFDTYVSHDISFKIIKMLRDKMYDHMDKIAPGGLEGRNSADSAMIILSDIEVFEWFFAHCLVEWLGTFVSLLVCMTLLCRVSIAAAAAVIIMLILMMTVPFFSMEQAKQKGLLMKRLYGALNGIVSDGVSGSKDVIAFHWTKAFFTKLDQTSETYFKAQTQFAKRNEWEKTLEAAVAGIAVLLGLLLTSTKLADGELTRLIPVFALITSSVGCIQGSLSEGTNFGFVFGAAGRMVSVLNISTSVEDTGTKTRLDVQTENGTWNLTLKDVGFQYTEDKPLLKGVSFEAQSSETVAIVAVSGGGKSTIAKLLQRFWDVATGGIYINGTDIRDLRLDALREIITVIPQETYLFHGSIRDNLKLARLQASEQDIETAVQTAQAASFIRRLDHGIDTAIGENGVMLSGGERQRIALAQAFLKDPPILVLDEATSALDTDNEQKINEAVKMHRRGKVTIVIAHRLSSMQSADRIVFIKDGRVIQTGTYHELLRGCEAFQDLVRGEYFENREE